MPCLLDRIPISCNITAYKSLEIINGIHFELPCIAETKGLLKRAYVTKGEIRYIGKETDRKWEEGDEISLLQFAATEHGRKGRVVASEDVKTKISSIGINKCARESGFDRKNFVRKLVRGLPVKRNSYNEFVRWLGGFQATRRSGD